MERARIVLLAAEGVSNKDIAEELSIDADTVCKWCKRFAQERLAGLGDRHRPGRPAVYSHDDRLKVIKTVTETPPEPASHWSGQQIADALAAEVGISCSQIWRILDDLDLKLVVAHLQGPGLLGQGGIESKPASSLDYKMLWSSSPPFLA